jgi:hypothetical protein
MTWTVDSGDVNAFAYSIINDTMFVSISLDTTVIGGTPNGNLFVAIPASKTCSKGVAGVYEYNNNATPGKGSFSVGAAGTVINLALDLAGTNWALGTTYIRAELFFGIS